MTARFRFQASLPRALAESGIVAVVLGFLTIAGLTQLPQASGRDSLWAHACIGLPFFVAMVMALRLKRWQGDRRQQIKRELATALAVLAASAGGLLVAAGLARLAVGPLGPGAGGVALLPLIVAVWAGASFVHYLTCTRGLVALWASWDRLRRRRLVWSIAHVQFLFVLVIAALLAVLITAFGGSWHSGGFPNDGGHLISAVLIQLAERVIPTFFVFVAGLLVIFLIGVVPALIISYVVLGRTTARIETLAQAANARRAGDLDVRVVVEGEDEVANLQTDFNAMVEDLGAAFRDLEQQRDAVARLLEDRRGLIASVSHELRTPVATLRGYLESGIEHWNGSPPATLKQDMEIMLRETTHLQRMIEDLFLLSRAEIGKLPLTMAPVEVEPMLRHVARIFAPRAWEHGRVEVAAQVDDSALLPAVLADPERLDQVLRNLVSNAVRHTPPGGLVVLSASRVRDRIVFEVKDTGEGIDPGDLPHIWDRFYRAGDARDRDRGGAGLGLALVKELTEAMGGSVEVESAPGQGSCFRLRLPVASSPLRHLAQPSPAVVAGAVSSGETVA